MLCAQQLQRFASSLTGGRPCDVWLRSCCARLHNTMRPVSSRLRSTFSGSQTPLRLHTVATSVQHRAVALLLPRREPACSASRQAQHAWRLPGPSLPRTLVCSQAARLLQSSPSCAAATAHAEPAPPAQSMPSISQDSDAAELLATDSSVASSSEHVTSHSTLSHNSFKQPATADSMLNAVSSRYPSSSSDSAHEDEPSPSADALARTNTQEAASRSQGGADANNGLHPPSTSAAATQGGGYFHGSPCVRMHAADSTEQPEASTSFASSAGPPSTTGAPSTQRTKRRRGSSASPHQQETMCGKPAKRMPAFIAQYDFAHFSPLLEQLQRYREAWGDCQVPKRLWDNRGLGEWVADMRLMGREGWLPAYKRAALEALGFDFKLSPADALWNFNLHELRRYTEEHGSAAVPFKWRDPTGDFSNTFAKWFHAQPTLFKQRRLTPAQVDKLARAGCDMRAATSDEVSDEAYAAMHAELAGAGASERRRAEFMMMFEELKAWKQRYYTTVVPRQVHDHPVLGEWTIRLRKAYKAGMLHDWQEELLDGIGFPWKVDQISAKWHSNLHHARRYKEKHGTAELPPDFYDAEDPDAVEAARWIARQRKLYEKQKLSERRLLILQEVLGLHFRRAYAPTRRNIHLHIQDDTVAPHERPFHNPSPNPNKHSDVRRKAERRRLAAERA